jgi:hypothetical protein
MYGTKGPAGAALVVVACVVGASVVVLGPLVAVDVEPEEVVSFEPE